MSQENKILAHLQSGRPLTPLQALHRFGCLRLASRILDLRRNGHSIHAQLVRRGGKTFAQYWLDEERV